MRTAVFTSSSAGRSVGQSRNEESHRPEPPGPRPGATRRASPRSVPPAGTKYARPAQRGGGAASRAPAAHEPQQARGDRGRTGEGVGRRLGGHRRRARLARRAGGVDAHAGEGGGGEHFYRPGEECTEGRRRHVILFACRRILGVTHDGVCMCHHPHLRGPEWAIAGCVPIQCPRHSPAAPRQLRDSRALQHLGAGRLSLVIPLGVTRRIGVPFLSGLQLGLKLLLEERHRARHVSASCRQGRGRVERQGRGQRCAEWTTSQTQRCGAARWATRLGGGLERLHRLAQRLAQLRQLGRPEGKRSDAANDHQFRQAESEEARHDKRRPSSSLPPRRRRAVSGQRARVAQERGGRPCAAGRNSSRVGAPGEGRAHDLHGVCVCLCALPRAGGLVTLTESA